MQKRAEKILFITSFLPVTAFKVIARIGAANLNQAKLAVAVGLVWALIQHVLTRKITKHNTYMEKAFFQKALALLLHKKCWILSSNNHTIIPQMEQSPITPKYLEMSLIDLFCGG